MDKKMILKNKYTRLLFISAAFIFSFLQAQTSIGIAPGDAVPLFRSHTVSIQPVTSVSISISGKDSIYADAYIDSFKVKNGTLDINTWFTLSISAIAPVGELSVTINFIYSADEALTRTISEEFQINTDVLPSIIASFSADVLEGSAPLTVHFTNTSEGSIIGYVWDFGDENTSLEHSPEHTYTTPGTYSVSLIVYNFTTQNQSVKENYIKVSDATALKDVLKIVPDDEILLSNYPNPFNPSTFISFKLKQQSPVKIEIFNNEGKYLDTITDDIYSAGDHKLRFDGSGLSSGVYYYKVISPSHIFTGKMMLLK